MCWRRDLLHPHRLPCTVQFVILLVGLDSVSSVYGVIRMVSYWPFVDIVLFVTNAIWTLSVLYTNLYVHFLSKKMYQLVLPAVHELLYFVVNALCNSTHKQSQRPNLSV